MPTVIDSLVVELGLDPKNFTKGQKEAVDSAKRAQQDLEQRLGNVETRADSASHSFSNLRNQALGALAVFTGGRGVVEFAKSIALTDASVSRTARSFGLSTEALSQWRGAASAAGGSADGITSTITGLIGQFQQFALTGESSVIPYFRSMGIQIADATGKMKPFSQLLLEMTQWAKGRDPAQVSAILSAVGIDAGTISMILQGEGAVRKLIATQKELGGVNRESAASAEGLTKGWSEMSTAAEALGRVILTKLAPALVVLLNGWKEIFGAFSKGELVEGSIAKRLWDGLSGKQTGEWSWSAWWKRNTDKYDSAKKEIDSGSIPGNPAPEAGGPNPYQRGADGRYVNPAAAEAGIRSEAAKRGIDPNTAMRVARGEGFNDFRSSVVTKDGTREKSYGAFQLYTGGGLGNEFQKATGLDPSDPKNEAATIRFALDKAPQTGWTPWYGARNNGIGPREGLPPPGSIAAAGAAGSGGGTTTNTTTITSMTVNTKATNAAELAAELPGAMKNSNLADQANSGLN